MYKDFTKQSKKRLLFLFSFFIFFVLCINPLFSFYLVAVGNNSGELIKFDVKKIRSNDKTTDVFIATDSYIGKDTQLSIKLAKDVICSLFPNKCKGYDFLVKIYGELPELTGPSGGSAFAMAMFRELFNLSDKNIAITGTINPGGVIGPVGGLNYKVAAARKLDYIIIPLGQKFYKDPFTNKTYDLTKINPNIREAGTIFDEAAIIWGLKFNFTRNKINVPKWYLNTMKKIAYDLCNKVSVKVDDSQDYYAQASKCFTDLINKKKEEFSSLNYDELIVKKEELNRTIQEFDVLLKSKFKEIKGLNTLQLYMILYERLNDAKEVLNRQPKDINEFVSNLAYVSSRLDTIKEWLKFLDVMPTGKEITYELLNLLCERDRQRALLAYNYLIGLYPLFSPYLQKDFDKLNQYYKKKNYILCIHYAKSIKYKVDSFLALLYLDDKVKPYFYNSTKKIARFYLLRNKEFPIMAYSYYKYSNYLANNEKDFDSAIIYLEESINLATMIYEINTLKNSEMQNVLKIIQQEDILKDKSILFFLIIFSVFLCYFIILKENKLV